MAKPEILRHSVMIDEQEVFGLIHSSVAIPEIRPSNFTGRIALWAEERERRGDSIRDIVTYTENGPHRVSWVRHEGVNEQTQEEFCLHHIVCDCALGIVEEDSPDAIVQHLSSCRAVKQALHRRAAYVDHVYHTGEVLNSLRDKETGDFEQSNSFHKFAVKTIGDILELDARHPEEWPANVINGEHRVSIMATLLQLHPEVVKWYGRLLEETGIIQDFDGEVLKLSPDALAA